MQIPKRPTATIEFTLEEHKDIEDAPVFTLRPLTDLEVENCTNLTAAERGGTALNFAATKAIKGWANLQPEYVRESSVSDLPILWRYEIGKFILNKSVLAETEKNS